MEFSLAEPRKNSELHKLFPCWQFNSSHKPTFYEQVAGVKVCSLLFPS